ncbi:MAG: nucleotide exchange factor GrpE [Candidatus Midichloria sp.]|uniref:Nucleotide exchange factor GrpE n=1 Tax=Hyalomma marginatum TaxID=34627 RepID=A0A8S4C0X4_9ACAR|nr:nucleotide exchange factor GrpE [Hyalomma marginatum]CAG7592056.1 nucleotide exchange factor GrpE [Hyalomma marginatum]
MEQENLTEKQDSINEQAVENKNAVEELSNKVKDLEKSLITLNDALLRAKAENENVRKRAAKELEDAHKYSISNFAKDLIEVLENLHRATENIQGMKMIENEQVKSCIEGVLITQKILSTVFEKHGITRIYPLNEQFDHNNHEAINQVEDGEREPNTIVQVIRAGYRIKDRLLQPAMVAVSRKP